jgi:hypothetical protein
VDMSVEQTAEPGAARMANGPLSARPSAKPYQTILPLVGKCEDGAEHEAAMFTACLATAGIRNV